MNQRTLEEVYCFWKQWYVQDAQMDFDEAITTNGTTMDFNGWQVIGATNMSSQVTLFGRLNTQVTHGWDLNEPALWSWNWNLVECEF